MNALAFAGCGAHHARMTIPAAPHASTPAAAPRWPLIDALRGAALVLMIIYHFSWDLSYLGLIATDVARHPAWSAFAMGIAGSFLTLVGVGFALGARQGLDRTRYLRRLGVVAGAAVLVSLATAYAMPDAPVLFGVLHCIALASVLIVPFLRAPVLLAPAAAAAAFALPVLVRSPAFDGSGWAWLGLARSPPPAVDHVPILPWFGCVLIGLAIGRLILDTAALARRREWIGGWRARALPARGLVRLGRWSLVVYLVHQPLLIGALTLFTALFPPATRIGDAAGFVAACQRTCRASAGEAATCAAYCGCAAEKLRATPMWANILNDRLTPDERTNVAELARQCAPGSASPRAN